MRHGYSAVPLATNDLMTSLQNGMVEAFYSRPWWPRRSSGSHRAKHMCGLRIAPMIGGLVVKG